MGLKRLFNRIPYQIRASFVILIASFITSAISFITTPIFTRLLSVEEYGVTVQFNSVLEIVSVIATLSLSAGVYQVAMNEFQDDRNSFTLSALVLSNICTTVVFVIIFLSYNLLYDVLHLPIGLMVCMYVYLMIYPATSMWLAKQRYEYQYKKVAIVSVVTISINLTTGIIAILLIKGHDLGAVKVMATSIAQIASSAIIYFSIAKNANYKVRSKYIKYAFLFNAPLIAHYLAQYVLRSSDKLMITYFWGEKYTGLYGLGTTVASIAVLAWSAMAASLTPYMYTHITDKQYEKVNKAVIAVLSIFGASCVIVSLIGPEVVYILGSSKYMENIQLIPPIAASSLLTAVYGIYSTIAFYHHKRISTAVMTVLAAGINIALNYVLIPKYGYIAAAYTTEAAYLIYTFLHFLNYRRIAEKDKIFNDFIIWGITIFTTLICLITGLFYNSWVIRYGMIVAIIIVVICLRKQVVSVLKQLFGNKKA